MCKDDQERVFKMLAAILWLGNISFQENDNENHIEVVKDDGMICNLCIMLLNGLFAPSPLVCADMVVLNTFVVNSGVVVPP